ncbi:efflux RND transporter periplasmic adaptor subunit [Alteromonas halophila]|uniref:RND transporter MFP subunit n=1 Tax=Alteromonas halophila TaxID=516698 RepID=A0A918JPJ4_9ALTE|nr:HlyD family efflux transporter periplasmic adaptor subunit [Alteromonas halophila]GGW91247.1 RND transporter MFP subunit [Alteromonas halophila]
MSIADTSGQDTLLSPAASSRRRTIWIVAVVALLILALVVALPAISNWQQSEASVPRDRLRIATVSYGDLIRDLSVEGRVVAAVSPRIYSPAQGTIDLHVDAGEQVTQGQVLATIDSPLLTNELQQEQSQYEALNVALERQRIQAKKQMLEDQKAIDLANVTLLAADREKRRADKAYETRAISNIDYEKAQDDLNNAQLVHEHAVQDAALNKESLLFEIEAKEHEANRQQLRYSDLKRQVDALTLRSPVTGIVGNLAVEQKNQVTKNQILLSVVDLTELELEVAIPESYADDLGIGMPAEVRFNNSLYAAKLISISPEIENNQVTGRVRFAPPEDDPDAIPVGLRQNQRLTTRILMENKPNVLMVQRGQFLDSGAGRIAYRVDGDMAHRVAIQTGARSLSSVEIVDGLAPDDQIIISGTSAFDGAQSVLITQ